MQYTASQGERFHLPRALFPALVMLAIGSGNARLLAESYRWQLDVQEEGIRLLEHERQSIPATGHPAGASPPCEYLRLNATAGSHPRVRCQMVSAPVIDELAIQLQMRGNRPGARMQLHIVLPRNLDSATGRPTGLMLTGPCYENTGNWQLLRMSGIGASLANAARVARSNVGHDVDTREAYVDAVLLPLDDRGGELEAWLTTPELQGFVPGGESAGSLPTPHLPAPRSESPITIKVRSGILEADGAPVFARVIREQHEDWAYLRDLGFDTILLSEPLTYQHLARAEQLNLWLVAPAPTGEGGHALLRRSQRVLGWTVQEAIPSGDSLRRLRDALQRPDDPMARPIVTWRVGGAPADSASSEIEVRGRPVLWTAGGYAGYLRDLRSQSVVARPESLMWGRIDASADPRLIQQLHSLGAETPLFAPERQQVELQCFAAIMGGARGLVFDSLSRLDAPTPEARVRSLTLQSVMERLKSIAPFAASGRLSTSIECLETDVAAVSLGTPACTLVLAARFTDFDPFVPPLVPPEPRTLAISGIPPLWEVYELAEETTRRLNLSSDAGLRRVTVPQVGRLVQLVAARDVHDVRQIAAQRARQEQGSLARRLELATLMQQETEHVLGQLARLRPPFQELQFSAEQVQVDLHKARNAIDRKDPLQAWSHLTRGEDGLATIRHQTWRSSWPPADSPSCCPLLTQFRSLATWAQLANGLTPLAPGAINLLPEGGCEDLARIRESGWQVVAPSTRHAGPPLRVVRYPAKSGRFSLHMTSAGQDGVTLKVRDIPLAAGQVVLIQGSVLVPQAPTAGPETRVTVSDSLAGPGLAWRKSAMTNWESFRMVRSGDGVQPLTLEVSLEGPGDLYLDDLSVTPVSISTSAPVQHASFWNP